ncbi:hypothetical protein IMCC1989_734 [gamma proteobacterium IMCC1989]|nr:hypothetical protein IMCC1989_734 [gamma proteobacterium IMCC1989]
MGLYQGCDVAIDEGHYALTISPVSAMILVAVWLLLFWLVSVVLKRF